MTLTTKSPETLPVGATPQEENAQGEALGVSLESAPEGDSSTHIEDKPPNSPDTPENSPDEPTAPAPDKRLEGLRKKAAMLPASAGVYLMKDKTGKVIYVGKAKLLPKRVVSYFQKNQPSARIALMVAQVNTFDFVVTTTEKEALLLENSLIKKHRPKYNVNLSDDKTYPSIRLSQKDPFPRLEIVRRPARDGSVIYGPFPSSGALKETLRIVNRLFPLRRCHREDVKKIDRPCLNYQIGICMGPCRPEVTPSEYKELTDEVRLFFQGKNKELKKELTSLMKKKAKEHDYEGAAVLRDRLYDLDKTLERQIVTSFEESDLDVWALVQMTGLTCGAVLNIRQGALSGCHPLFAKGTVLADEGDYEAQALLSLISQYYDAKTPIPPEILVPALPKGDDERITLEFLRSLSGKKVSFVVPKKGPRLKLLDLARENAKAILEERLAMMTKTTGAMAELKNRLHLPKVPRRIECFDLAHMQGEANVSGMVVMEEGEFKKSQYRKFKIKEAKGGDDYEGMREVIRRRFAHDKEPDKWPPPDLLLLDGGRGQITAALKAFTDLGIEPPPMAGIAKDRDNKGPDRIFLPGRKNPADLKPGSAGLIILSKLRDEAHRFSRTYHHHLMTKDMLTSIYSGIPGLGPKREKALEKKFPTLAELREATDEEIIKVAHINQESISLLRKKIADLLENKKAQDA
ncbi:MAG: excinuclease ABC subunit UvrC [Deltaproteobacteria bacterium]|jgi:excinuclease ABC subunit C|nr:excinuclease ABC subunit UvrC [Deltaproteobacteria bacterium]